MSKQYRRLEFTNFPRVWGTIIIPARNFVVYRSGTKTPIFTNDPRFFSDFENANIYTKMNSNYKVYACILKELKLMDLRSMKYLLLEYVAHNKIWFNTQQLVIIEKALFALGLMPIQSQYEYLSNDIQNLGEFVKIYPSLVNVYEAIQCYQLKTPPNDIHQYDVNKYLTHLVGFGSRISSCAIDDEVVGLLKYLFGDTVDGYIAPTQETVWHNHNFHPELCLFNPNKSLSSVTDLPSNITNPDALIIPYSINDILLGYTIPTTKGYDLLRGGSEFTSECKVSTPFLNIEQNFAYESETSQNIAKIWQEKTLENSKTNSKKSNKYGLNSEIS